MVGYENEESTKVPRYDLVVLRGDNSEAVLLLGEVRCGDQVGVSPAWREAGGDC